MKNDWLAVAIPDSKNEPQNVALFHYQSIHPQYLTEEEVELAEEEE
jgi:hypothetical protein